MTSQTTQAWHEGPTFRRIREERGLTRERLAAIAGVSVATIYRLEVGRVQPTRVVQRAVATALDPKAERQAVRVGVPEASTSSRPARRR